MANLEGYVTTKAGQIVGTYQVSMNNLTYRKTGTYDFQLTHPISDQIYYDEYDHVEQKVRDSFNGSVVLLCEANQCLLEIQENGREWNVIEHQYGNDSRGNIHGDNYREIIFRLKSAKHMDLMKQYHEQLKGRL